MKTGPRTLLFMFGVTLVVFKIAGVVGAAAMSWWLALLPFILIASITVVPFVLVVVFGFSMIVAGLEFDGRRKKRQRNARFYH